MRKRTVMRVRWAVLLLCLGLLTTGMAGQTPGASVPNWKGPNGPIDLQLQDPALIGALDLHAHLDPDISGGGQVPRAMNAVEMAQMARARGMRGFVHKTHMDVSSAASAYFVREADFYQEGEHPEEKIAFAVKQIRRLGAESIIMGTDCGQLNNPLPADCIALGARALRARGITDRQLDAMLKENPARFLGLPPPAPARQTASAAPPAMRKPGIYKSAAQIRAEIDKTPSTLGIVGGQVTQVVEAGGGQIVVRRRVAGPNNASVHEDLTEVYQFVAGSGTFVTGGTMPDPKDRTAGIKGGVSQKVQPGDFVILPPGTPHWFSQIDGSVTYVETRFPVK